MMIVLDSRESGGVYIFYTRQLLYGSSYSGSIHHYSYDMTLVSHRPGLNLERALNVGEVLLAGLTALTHLYRLCTETPSLWETSVTEYP